MCCLRALLLFLGCCGSAAWGVPLTKHESYMFVAATWNGQPLTLVVDTGAGLNVLTPQAAQRLGLAVSQETTAVTGAAGQTRQAPGVWGDLEVGGQHDPAARAVLLPLPSELGIDGLLGTPFLSRFLVTLDSAHARMELEPPDTTVAGVPLPFQMLLGIPHLRARVAGQPGWLEIDTGAGEALNLSAGFVEHAGLAELFPDAVEGITGEGVDGLLREKLVRLPEVSVGSFALRQVTASLSVRPHAPFAEDQPAGRLGAEIWERFLLKLDYSRGCAYLEPNERLDEPFVGNRSGLGLQFPGGRAQVVSVLARTPAAEVGIQPGDRLLRIDGAPVELLGLWQVRRRLHEPPGTELRLELQRADGTPYAVVLRLRELV